MPRKYDDRPLANDPGMEDKPLARLTPFGQWVYHTVLHRNLNLECIPSAAKMTFSFTSIDQFLKAARGIARLAHKPVAQLAVVDESVGGHTQWALTYPARNAKTGEVWILRISGDVVPRFVRAGILPVNGHVMALDVAAPISAERINALLHALPQEEGGSRVTVEA
jgi:hypothetical protein